MILHRTSRKNQQGLVLVISLVVLMVLFIVGLAGLQSTVFNEKIASNTGQLTLALQSADTTLRDAEASIEAMTTTSAFDSNSNGLYTAGHAPNPFADSTWTGTASKVSSVTYENDVIKPRYFIEKLGAFGDASNAVGVINYGYNDAMGSGQVTVFRVVVKGTGSAGTAQVIIESFYGKAF